MTELRELFEDAAPAPPPTRLLADEVYAAGRRRLRRRRAAIAGTAFGVTAVVAATAALVAVPGTAPAPPERAAAPGTAGQPGRLPHQGTTQSIWAADPRHVYLGLSTCAQGGPCKTTWQLVGTDDGGRTWTERGNPGWFIGMQVFGPGLLLVDRPPESSGAGAWTLLASRDGGRSWRATGTGPAVPAVAPGSHAVCRPEAGTAGAGSSERIPGTEPCRVYAFDPVANRISPLAVQPPSTLVDRQVIEQGDGRLRVSGYDRESSRPAIVTSTDGGRNWSSHTFTESSVCGADNCPMVQVATGPGGVDHAMLTDGRHRAVYRYTTVGGWQRRDAADSIPYEGADSGSFVTPDGSHVVYQASTGRAGPTSTYRFWAARPGAPDYRPVELPGLPRIFSPVRRTPDGWLYARGDGDVSYGSTDGWHWVPLNVR
ncbi:hypothetical protein O7626_04370 [Micromonospora sp. WMMD1102]|uniref:hypothetical protein n=1 Tax=Micromonospora sp. WMMD1102 TaxID=3016105 RepID=UPI002414FFC1|nr:hypothetical protein [Micromonospora sp. WMMD1102]MDG4785175.1 hypothetical protein [Micromonospora sp. WMMD1102]